MRKTMMALAAGWMLTTLAGIDPLEKFWLETKGRTIRRLPVQIVPENVFQSLSETTFAEPAAYTRQLVKDVAARSTYNVITLTLRSIPDLSDKITEERVQDFIRTAHAEGQQVLMDIDPRIARFEFLRRWPDAHAGILRLGQTAPTNGVAAFDLAFGNYRDHMAWGSRAAYATLESRVVDAFAVKMAATGRPDWSTRRDLTAAVQAAATCVSNRVTGTLGGLAADERLVVAARFKLLAADPCAPAITPFLKELALRYKALGADGAMRDEWGFPPMRDEWRGHATFHFTSRFAALYAAHLPGHDYLKDMELVVVDPQAETARTAIDAMGRTIYDRIVQTEREFYDLNREIFGPDVYVTKHPTWHTYFTGTEFMHNGFDWWGAKRDWAQSDEGVPLPCICGMAKKMGGPCWMNEGYGPNPEHYGRAVWKYALAGGRMVYHGIYGGNSSVKRLNLPPTEAKRRTALDILRPENVSAQARVRLLNLISRAQIDCPTALVFGHRRLMNWTDAAYEDGGLALAHALGGQGHYVDAYPSTEFEFDTFRVDAEGYLAVGAQRYTALVFHRLDAADMAAFARLVKGRSVKTALFSWDSPARADVTALASPSNAAPVVAVLEKSNATKQTPLTAHGLHPYSSDRLPGTAGTLRLLDGTVARIRACQPQVSGDALDEALDTGHGRVYFQANGGLFAARFDARGEVEALAVAGLRTVRAKNLELTLPPSGEDIVLVRREGRWQGLWQTAAPEAPMPAALKALTDDWRILALPSAAPTGAGSAESR